MSFRSVFIAVFIGTAIVVAAFFIHKQRPAAEVEQPTQDLVRATGKCATCHLDETSAVVHQYERSAHARKGVNCLDCHRPAQGQEGTEHKGFTIAKSMTSQNCASCHATEYDQFARSRHAGPAWAAVAGSRDFTEAQIELSEKYHPGTVKRPANRLAQLEGPGAITKGCGGCHSIGKPNPDGSFGTCTDCHSRHSASIRLARHPSTCGQCHMGPDHSQIEIYNESKHGALFQAQKGSLNLDADPKKLTTRDMPIPTCSTCHMSGLEGMDVTHDVTERLSWYLFAEVSEKRPDYARKQAQMQELCKKCHTGPSVKQFYDGAETVLHTTNEKVERAKQLMSGLREDGLLTAKPFDEPIEFLEFDLWHYFGRTAKHGAFMGGADFVQWHGNYELLHYQVKLEKMAEQLRAEHPTGQGEGSSKPSQGQSETDSGAERQRENERGE